MKVEVRRRQIFKKWSAKKDFVETLGMGTYFRRHNAESHSVQNASF